MRRGSLNPVAQFEYDLTRIVGRATRSTEYRSAIKEFSSHFADIFEEEIALGLDNADAERKARSRMGNLYAIAFQIVNTPERAKKGIRIQWIALAVYLSMVACYLGAVMATDASWWLEILPRIVQMTELLFLLAGLALGYGILLAKKLLWKPLLLVTALVFVGGGFGIGAGSQPQRYFHMSQSEAKALVAKQAAIEPEIAKLENQVLNVLNRQDRKPEVFSEQLTPLTAMVESSKLPFFKVLPGTSGSYLYPASIDYPKDKTYCYAVTLKRTDNLPIAQKQWGRSVPAGAEISMAIYTRQANFDAYRSFAATKPAPWTLGFNLSAILALGCTGAFLMLAAAGYMLARIRILGLDWFRLSRV